MIRNVHVEADAGGALHAAACGVAMNRRNTLHD